tara:strand:+ start:3793 stop:4050 length:258 start_codon:yes stop_codon:yes gene_type:complete
MSIRYKIKKLNAQFHLKHICIHCSHHKQETRDILHDNHCFWNENWKKGKHNIPPLMGFWNYIRLYILKLPIKICFHGKMYKGAEV